MMFAFLWSLFTFFLQEGFNLWKDYWRPTKKQVQLEEVLFKGLTYMTCSKEEYEQILFTKQITPASSQSVRFVVGIVKWHEAKMYFRKKDLPNKVYIIRVRPNVEQKERLTCSRLQHMYFYKGVFQLNGNIHAEELSIRKIKRYKGTSVLKDVFALYHFLLQKSVIGQFTSMIFTILFIERVLSSLHGISLFDKIMPFVLQHFGVHYL